MFLQAFEVYGLRNARNLKPIAQQLAVQKIVFDYKNPVLH